MKPHCNRCFGYLAMVFQIDYYCVDSLTAYYHKQYVMTTARAADALLVVSNIISERGLKYKKGS